MPIRITGLNSGLDTEAIISALVSSYNYKTQKYQKAQTKLSWKQDAWKELNTKIYSLYTSVGNLRFSTAYNMKSTTVSDSTKVSVTAGSSSVNGSYSVQVTSLAKAGYLTGARLDSGTTASTTLGELGYTGTDGKMSVTVGGKTTDITVSKDSTIQEVVNQLKEAGVNASYDETNRRFFVSAKDTGIENDFSLSGADASGTAALTVLGLNVASTANTAEYEALAQYATMSVDDMKQIVADKVNATNQNTELKAKNANYQSVIEYAKAAGAISAVGTGADVELLKTLASTSDLKDQYVDADGNIYKKDSESGKYTTIDASGNKIEVEEADIKDTSKYTAATDKYNELAKSYGLIKDKLDEEGNVVLDDEGNAVQDDSALTEFKKNLNTVKTISDKAENADSEELKNMLADAESAVATGTVDSYIADLEAEIATNNATIEANNALLTNPDTEKLTVSMTDEQVEAFKAKADYAQDVLAGRVSVEYSTGATRINGSDAKIYVNGAEYEGDSNTFSINGLTITATGVTTTEAEMQVALANGTEAIGAVNVTVNTDVQGIYDKVKDFLTQYNALINEMTSLYNADSAKGYEPLTDEEKDAMSDTEVEKWEEKIKSSLLRRDDTLSSLMSAMTGAMSKGVTINGKSYYLSNFGIKTLGYLNAPKNEQNAYHIDGDEDDINTSGNADKLMAAIADDPDTVMEFMQGLTKNLYEAVDKKMKGTTLSSTYTVYNDKEMASEYSDYTSLITKWQERLEQQEEYYYQKFSAMETALSKLNSQTSSLTGLFG